MCIYVYIYISQLPFPDSGCTCTNGARWERACAEAGSTGLIISNNAIYVFLVFCCCAQGSSLTQDECPLHAREFRILAGQIAATKQVLARKTPAGKKVRASICKECGSALTELNHRVRDGALCTTHRLRSDLASYNAGEIVKKFLTLQRSMKFCKHCQVALRNIIEVMNSQVSLCWGLARPCAAAFSDVLQEPVCESKSDRSPFC